MDPAELTVIEATIYIRIVHLSKLQYVIKSSIIARITA